jgi:hypothetical protein
MAVTLGRQKPLETLAEVVVVPIFPSRQSKPSGQLMQKAV